MTAANVLKYNKNQTDGSAPQQVAGRHVYPAATYRIGNEQ